MKRRRLNAKLLLALVGATAVLGVGLHFLHGSQVKRSADVLRDQARRAEESGDPAKAQDYLERYLAYRPEDVPALLELGELLEKQSETGAVRLQAIRVYEKALVRDPGQKELRRKVVRLWLGLTPPSFTGARPHLDFLMRDQPEDAELLDLLGQCQEGMGELENAAESYQQSINRGPTRIDTYERLANLLRQRLNDAGRADRLMNVEEVGPAGLIAANPDSARAYLVRGRYRERNGIKGATEDIAHALELAPDDVDVLLAASIVARDLEDLDTAREQLKHALEQDPKRTALYQALADVELRAKQPEKAVAWLQQGIEKLPEEITLRYTLAGTLAQVGQLKQARDEIKKLEAEGLRPELVQYLTAHVLMEEKQWEKARDLLDKAQLYLASRLEARELNKRVLMMLGECCQMLNDLDGRYNAYRAAVAIDLNPDPYWETARLQLAEALRAKGDVDAAIREYLVVLPRAPKLRIPVARLVTLYNLQVPPAEQRWQIVEQLINEVEKDEPNSLDVPILRSEVLLARRQTDQARALLEKTRDAHPRNIEPWLALIGLAERQNQPSLPILDAADQALGLRLELLMARAQYWARHRGPDAPEALVDLERKAGSLAAEEQTRLWREIALAYAVIGAPDRANRLWKQISERLPSDLSAQLTLFDMAIQVKDEPSAQQAIERLKAIEGPDGTLWRYGEGVLLTQKARKLPADERRPLLTQARNLLMFVEEKRPTWSRVSVSLGDVAAVGGNEAEALRNYLVAIDDKKDRSPGALIAAAQLLYSQKLYSRADQMIGLLREQNYPISGELQRLVAEIAFQNRDYLRAVEQAQQVVSDQSESYRDLIWLGRLRWAAGQDAEPVLRRAIEKGGKVPETWITLVVYLASPSVNRRQEAAEVLAEAEKQISPEEAPLALAEGHEAVGHADRARDLYEKAVERNPDDLMTLKGVAAFYLRTGRLAASKPLLQRIVDKHPDTPDAKAAKRTLLLVMAAGGNKQEAVEALKILGLDDKNQPGQGISNVDDMRTKAKVLAMQPNRTRRQEAISVLQELIDQKKASGEDLLLLAQLQEANGNWDEARSTMRKLLDTNRQNPGFLATYIRSLLRHDSLTEARVYLDQLVKLAPDQPATIEIQARVLHAQKRDAEAASLLTEFAQGDPARLGQTAALLDELGQKKAAEQLYRAFADKFAGERADAVLPLAGFLGRQGRVSEALDLIDAKVWGKLPDDRACNVIVSLLYTSRSDRSQYDRIAQRLQEASQRNPDQISIQFDMANLLSLRGEYDKAATIYRKVFEREPSRGIALNNLAWMLCLQGGRNSEALEAIDQAIKIEGETPDLLDTRALVRLAMGEPNPAIQDLEDALVVSPNNREMYFHLAQAYQEAGRPGEAGEALRKARDLGLTPDRLHPLERPKLTALIQKLGLDRH